MVAMLLIYLCFNYPVKIGAKQFAYLIICIIRRGRSRCPWTTFRVEMAIDFSCKLFGRSPSAFWR